MTRYYWARMRCYRGDECVSDETAEPNIEIFRTKNRYHIFVTENHQRSGTKEDALNYIEAWKNDLQDVVRILEDNGLKVVFEQTLMEGEA